MASETWIADSSPLILFAKIGFLPIARGMAADLIIPADVLDEINAAPPEDTASQKVNEMVGMGIATISTPRIPPLLAARGLGRGETAVLAEALQRAEGGGTVAVLDDHDGRRAAKTFGIPVLGTVGILIRAKDDGQIAALHPYLRALQDAGLWGSDAFYQQVALSVGETWP